MATTLGRHRNATMSGVGWRVTDRNERFARSIIWKEPFALTTCRRQPHGGRRQTAARSHAAVGPQGTSVAREVVVPLPGHVAGQVDGKGGVSCGGSPTVMERGVSPQVARDAARYRPIRYRPIRYRNGRGRLSAPERSCGASPRSARIISCQGTGRNGVSGAMMGVPMRSPSKHNRHRDWTRPTVDGAPSSRCAEMTIYRNISNIPTYRNAFREDPPRAPRPWRTPHETRPPFIRTRRATPAHGMS